MRSCIALTDTSMFSLIRSAARSVAASSRALVAGDPSRNPSAEQVAAVANYLHFIGLEQVHGWDRAIAAGDETLAATFQGGAAACKALSDVLLGVATGEKDRAKAALKELVNGAFEAQIVSI